MIPKNLLFLAIIFHYVRSDDDGDKSGTYINPVYPFDSPDPGVVFDKASNVWYAATTGCVNDGCFPIHTSSTLGDDWIISGSIFNSSDNLPTWSDKVTYWAPEIHFIPGKNGYVVFFAARLLSSGALCVGVAESLTTSPLGPYRDRGSPLILSPPGSCFGVIDPTYYFDTLSNKSYVIYKHDGNSCGQPTSQYAQLLSDDGMSLDTSSPPIFLITNDPRSWENNLVEAPWMLSKGGELFLFYGGGGGYDTPGYSVGVARSSNGLLTGPWIKNPLNPVLRTFPGGGTNGSPLFFGPGHTSVLQTQQGNFAYLYAAWGPAKQNGRNLMLDTISFDSDGWPSVRFISNTTQPLP
jgi:beta-xylosidase